MSFELENLVRIGKLKREPPDSGEFAGLVRAGRARLADAGRAELALESRFDLAYNASHALALAALRRLGYRSDQRYLVFQCLSHTLGVGRDVHLVLDQAHRRRNQAEYEGAVDVDEKFLAEVLAAARTVETSLLGLPPP